MFVTLLLVTLGLSASVAVLVAAIFGGPIRSILDRLVGDALVPAWARYVRFAIVVVGVSGGVRLRDLERYVVPGRPEDAPLVLDTNRWILEVYGTLIGTLQSIAWMLLVFFLFALVAYVVVRGFELRHARRSEDQAG